MAPGSPPCIWAWRGQGRCDAPAPQHFLDTGERAYGAVEAPGWVLPLGAVLAIGTSLLPMCAAHCPCPGSPPRRTLPASATPRPVLAACSLLGRRPSSSSRATRRRPRGSSERAKETSATCGSEQHAEHRLSSMRRVFSGSVGVRVAWLSARGLSHSRRSCPCLSTCVKLAEPQILSQRAVAKELRLRLVTLLKAHALGKH